MRVEEITAREAIIASKLPDADFTINPYIGCQFGCFYCYATYMGQYVHESRANWGNYVCVRSNLPELVQVELAAKELASQKASILLSSVTDPYQGVESQYMVTRRILEAFRAQRYPGKISILTKSPLVLRDADLLQDLPNVEVGITVTTTDDQLSRFLEVSAPLASRRIETLHDLGMRGISTYAFIGPLLPHFRLRTDLLDDLFAAVSGSGCREVYVEHINLPTYVKERMWKALRQESEDVQALYEQADTAEHRSTFDDLVYHLLAKHGLTLRLNRLIEHAKPSRERGPASVGEIPGIIDLALATAGKVRIGYEDRDGNVTERVVSPIEWSDFDRRKFRAFCHLRQDERHFVVERIQYCRAEEDSEPTAE